MTSWSIGAIFLETVPQSHQWLLTLLSAWWALGQLFASLIAWAFIGNFSCDDSIAAGECPKADNMGWRYTFYTLGAVTFAMFIFRFILFDLQESAKYLVAKGRHAEAIEVLHHIARKNGKAITLTVKHFDAIGGQREASNLTKMETIRKSLTGLSLSHVRPLFATRRLAINTTITVLLWGIIGLAYPLFNGFITLYLKARVPAGSSSVGTTYRNYTIISVLGIPGSILACLVVDWTRKDKSRFALGGRKLAMTITTALTGVFLFLFTTAKGEDAVLGYNCASALTTNAMYGVLYAYTPEVFPAPHRGTGDAIASAFNRITGLLAPIIKIATTSGGATTSAANGPIFVSASLFMAASALMMLLPIETAGKAAL